MTIQPESTGCDNGAWPDFPGRYLRHETMARLSKALKVHDKAVFCELPFCHTVEAEALGGIVNYGDEKLGQSRSIISVILWKKF